MSQAPASVMRRGGREARKEFAGMQPGDVKATYADIDESRRDLGFEPRTSIEDGLYEPEADYTTTPL